uniref:Uncharacterized protein n=1 Tax=Rhizophora mucronata TaxID=61149 RepID=A0A2P2KAE2_RHIMU
MLTTKHFHHSLPQLLQPLYFRPSFGLCFFPVCLQQPYKNLNKHRNHWEDSRQLEKQ